MIIGITGTNAAGKGETSNILKRLGYKYYSLSDMIREEASLKKEEPNRDNLIRIGNEFRLKYGEGIWGKKLAEKLKHEERDKIVIDSIRHPMEVKELKKLLENPDFLKRILESVEINSVLDEEIKKVEEKLERIRNSPDKHSSEIIDRSLGDKFLKKRGLDKNHIRFFLLQLKGGQSKDIKF